MVYLHFEKPTMDGIKYILKHTTCEPYVRCYYWGCRKLQTLDDCHLEYDIWIGDGFVNYCNRECREADKHYIDENWDKLMAMRKPREMTIYKSGQEQTIVVLY